MNNNVNKDLTSDSLSLNDEFGIGKVNSIRAIM